MANRLLCSCAGPSGNFRALGDFIRRSTGRLWCRKRIVASIASMRRAPRVPHALDVPRFIKKLASGNAAGSARTILDANILGASCARAWRSRCYAKARA